MGKVKTIPVASTPFKTSQITRVTFKTIQPWTRYCLHLTLPLPINMKSLRAMTIDELSITWNIMILNMAASTMNHCSNMQCNESHALLLNVVPYDIADAVITTKGFHIFESNMSVPESNGFFLTLTKLLP